MRYLLSRMRGATKLRRRSVYSGTVRSFLTTFGFWLIFLLPQTSHAYIGPGLGAGTIGVILGAVASVFLALFAILWYPIKRLFKKKGKNKERGSDAEE